MSVFDAAPITLQSETDARPAPLSNRLIADVLGVSEKTVRNDARSRAPLPRQYVTGADGKQYPSTPARARWMSEDGTLGAVITPQERRRRAAEELTDD